MVRGDADAAGAIHVRAWQAAYRGLMPDAYLDGLDVAERQRQWASQLAGGPPEGAAWLVVEDDDGVVAGICAVGPAHDAQGEPTGEGELYMINLDPSRWGRGLGRLLLAAATDWLRAEGWSEAVLWMAEGNQRAGRLYERNGWALDGGRKDDTIGGTAVPEVRYGRSLD
jgi:RimJ/RimL family protein N-acetyltransferase